MVVQHLDKILKGIAKEDAFSLINKIPLEMLNITPDQLQTKTIICNPTELLEINPKLYHADFIMELDHVILITEFQSTYIDLHDKRQFRLYTALKDKDRTNNKPMYLIVFSTVEKTKIIDYKINDTCSFKILVISLKNHDAEEAINIIETKIKNNQKINQTELINLALSPLMSFEGTIEEQLEKTVKTLNKLINSINRSSEFVFGITWLLIDKFIENENTRKRLCNLLSDNMRLIEEFGQSKFEDGMEKGIEKGIRKGKKEGKAEGKMEGIIEGMIKGEKRGEEKGIIKGEKRGIKKGKEQSQIEIAKELLKANIPINTISHATKIPKNQLKTLYGK
ncbi:hypothetical protein [uncultured Methanobrevibacter sp.]|uniref:hypothetical protein n=1 Tax=uncultured Methanobrevibacter sp. TaxID=253161 RepID=UPI00260BE774|nr:hypothetical protein [uncultured Methanobrevibacter sp.]